MTSPSRGPVVAGGPRTVQPSGAGASPASESPGARCGPSTSDSTS
jgi:hypothetical protein